MFGTTAASVLLIAGSALATTFTTVTPCYSCPSSVSVAPITVTSQYQTVSTCAPTTICRRGNCKTSYPFSTWAYVSTVIPVVDGTTTTSATVTTTNQLVTVSKARTTLTSYPSGQPGGRGGRFGGPYGRPGKSSPVYKTIGQDYILPYNQIGPLAIRGYGGSGLCIDCGKDGKGVFHQPLAVTECTASAGSTHCVAYTHTLVSTSAPAATTTSAAVGSTSFNAPSAGIYTFTFPHTAPARTITAHGHTFTMGAHPYNIYASQYFPHRGPWQVVTTVYTTITQYVPYSTKSATTTQSASVPGAWGGPKQGSASTTGSSSSSGASPVNSPSKSTPGSPATTAGPSFTGHSAAGPSVYITVNAAGARYPKQSATFVAIQNGDGVLVGAQDAATPFSFGGGYLFDATNWAFVGSDGSSSSAPFEEFPTAPSNGKGWISFGSSITLGGSSFCHKRDGSLFIVKGGSSPSDCTPVVLGPFTATSSSSSSTSTSFTSTWSAPNSDPSSDPDPEPIRKSSWEGDW